MTGPEFCKTAEEPPTEIKNADGTQSQEFRTLSQSAGERPGPGCDGVTYGYMCQPDTWED